MLSRGARGLSGLCHAPSRRVLEVVHVRDQCDYLYGLDLQRNVQDAKIVALREGGDVPRDVLILMEHRPVYTLGRHADPSNVLFDTEDEACTLHRVERGGEVTYHGPGQIVGYPIFDLRRHKKDLHWYMRSVEQVIIQVLGRHGLEGDRKEKYTGVWVGNEKVCAIGLNASKWVTSHGFGLNVTTDLSAFSKIIPCGITEEGTGVASIESLEKKYRIAAQQGPGGNRTRVYACV
mmetsp:Transcript_24930/g.53809  ORF Transcript_24930/g.53809 Transcript_24930/m.53809 type:complete len:234 (+) Transcript_24930:40-741(+)